jgi:hypothetical protein
MEIKVSNKQIFKAILNCTDNVQSELRTIILDNCKDSSLKMIQNEVIYSLRKSKKELIKDEFSINEKFNRTHFAKEIGVSREYVLRIIKKLK